MNRQPNQYDLLKVLLLILVVAGHVFNRFTPENYPGLNTRLLEVVTAFIYYWHMPAFMAVSGAVFAIGISRGKYREFSPFAWDKTKRLLIPFIAIAFIFMLPVGLFLHDGNVTMELVKERYLGLFNGDARHLWFILVLFEIFLVQFVVIKLKVNDFLVLTVSLVVSVVFLTCFYVPQLNLHLFAYYYPCFLTATLSIATKSPTYC